MNRMHLSISFNYIKFTYFIYLYFIFYVLTELCQALASAGGYNKMLGTQTVLGESASQGVKVPRMGFHRGWRLN